MPANGATSVRSFPDAITVWWLHGRVSLFLGDAACRPRGKRATMAAPDSEMAQQGVRERLGKHSLAVIDQQEK